VINSNVVHVYLIPFSRYWHILLENSLFSPPHPCLTPPSGETPCDINVIYTPLERTFSGLQTCRRHYGSILIHSFSRYCLTNSRNDAKFRQNLTLQQFKVIQCHRSWYQSKAHHMRLPISHNSNVGRICCHFRDIIITLKATHVENSWFSPPHPSLTPTLEGIP